MEIAFGAVACGGDAGQGFVVGEERVDTQFCGEFGFEAIGALDVPGGEYDLGEKCAFGWGVGAELEGVG